MTFIKDHCPSIYLSNQCEFKNGKVKSYIYTNHCNIILGQWHTENEDERLLKANSLLINLPDSNDYVIQLWGSSKSTEHRHFEYLATIISEDMGKGCHWYYIEDLSDWIDNQSLANDLPVIDDQELGLVIKSRSSKSQVDFKFNSPHEDIANKDIQDLYDLAHNSNYFDSDLSIQLESETELESDSRQVQDLSNDLNTTTTTTTPTGSEESNKSKKVSGKFDHFFDGLEDDVKEKNDKKFSTWYIFGIIIVIVFILIALYACYRLYTKLSQLEECCNTMSCERNGYIADDENGGIFS